MDVDDIKRKIVNIPPLRALTPMNQISAHMPPKLPDITEILRSNNKMNNNTNDDDRSVAETIVCDDNDDDHEMKMNDSMDQNRNNYVNINEYIFDINDLNNRSNLTDIIRHLQNLMKKTHCYLYRDKLCFYAECVYCKSRADPPEPQIEHSKFCALYHLMSFYKQMTPSDVLACALNDNTDSIMNNNPNILDNHHPLLNEDTGFNGMNFGSFSSFLTQNNNIGYQPHPHFNINKTNNSNNNNNNNGGVTKTEPNNGNNNTNNPSYSSLNSLNLNNMTNNIYNRYNSNMFHGSLGKFSSMNSLPSLNSLKSIPSSPHFNSNIFNSSMNLDNNNNIDIKKDIITDTSTTINKENALST